MVKLGLPKAAFLCGDKLGNLIWGVAQNFFLFIAMVIMSNGLHFFLKPYSQPRITSDVFVSFSISYRFEMST
jgi:hypothetical protein